MTFCKEKVDFNGIRQKNIDNIVIEGRIHFGQIVINQCNFQTPPTCNPNQFQLQSTTAHNSNEGLQEFLENWQFITLHIFGSP